MGWSFGWDSRRSLIEYITRDEENGDTKWTRLAHCARGNVVWSVWRIERAGETETYIRCDLIQRWAHDGIVEWGYKAMSESMGPYYYTCPLSYLDMAPVASEEWRERVRQYHKRLWKASA